MRRELSSHNNHGHEHEQQDTSILPTSTELGRQTRIVQPPPLRYRRDLSSYDTTYTPGLHNERLPPWFTSRSSRYACGLDLPSTCMSAAESAHMSLAHDLHTSHDYDHGAYNHEAERYSNRYIRYYLSRGPDYPPAPKKENKADDVRVQRRGDKLLLVRKKGKKEEGGGWEKMEKEVEWHRGRRWM